MVYNLPMIVRMADIVLIRAALRRSRVVALVGPRQCGKTTLAREFVAPDSLNYFDLEDPQSLARLTEPDTALRPLKKLVVIASALTHRCSLLPCGSLSPISNSSGCAFCIRAIRLIRYPRESRSSHWRSS